MYTLFYVLKKKTLLMDLIHYCELTTLHLSCFSLVPKPFPGIWPSPQHDFTATSNKNLTIDLEYNQPGSCLLYCTVSLTLSPSCYVNMHSATKAVFCLEKSLSFEGICICESIIHYDVASWAGGIRKHKADAHFKPFHFITSLPVKLDFSCSSSEDMSANCSSFWFSFFIVSMQVKFWKQS